MINIEFNFELYRNLITTVISSESKTIKRKINHEVVIMVIIDYFLESKIRNLTNLRNYSKYEQLVNFIKKVVEDDLQENTNPSTQFNIRADGRNIDLSMDNVLKNGISKLLETCTKEGKI